MKIMRDIEREEIFNNKMKYDDRGFFSKEKKKVIKDKKDKKKAFKRNNG